MNKELQKKKKTHTNKNIYKVHQIPHSIEAEQIVLGCIMIDKKPWSYIEKKLNKNDFYCKEHKNIFSAMLQLTTEQKPLNINAITEYLESQNKLQDSGGTNYLSELVNNITRTNNISIYVEILKKKSILRKILNIGKTLINYCYSVNVKTLTETLYEIEKKIHELLETDEKNIIQRNITPISKIFKNTILTLDKLAETNTITIGLTTGFKEFDKITSGLQKGNLIVIAGRPSMGKTTFALNIIEHLLINTTNAIVLFSMEMQSEQIAIKLLASLSNINIQKLTTGQLDENDWKKLTTNISLITKKNFFIDDTSTLTSFELTSKIHSIKKKIGKLDIIIIDYIQLMQIPKTKETRTTEISEISRNLKILAKNLDIPIIILSQLNRNLEQRQDKRPMMSDLRESGAIEQDADLIVFIYREEIYNKKTKNKNIAEIIIEKQRNGPSGSLQLKFVGEYSRFENITKQ